jgi:tRNA threonylcarbamoyl adenosine modification protein YeaZ
MLLSIDTSSSHCLVTLGDESGVLCQGSGRFFFRRVENERSHTKILLPLIQELLVEAKIELKDLSGLSVAVGPGSFVGVRLGVSVAQGLAYGSNLLIWPVSSLKVLAQSYLLAKNPSLNLISNLISPLDSDFLEIKIVRDAHMGDLYVGEYRLDPINRRTMEAKIPDYIEKKSETSPAETMIFPDPHALHQVAWDSFIKQAGDLPENVSPVYLRGANLWKKQD